MENLQNSLDTFTWLLPVIIILALWDSVWKLIGLWKAARNNHLGWFICIGIFNTMGIVPIIYILSNKKPRVLN